MKIDQTTFGDQGNCMAASVATVLDLPLREVPDLRGVDWFRKLRRWAHQRDIAVDLWAELPSTWEGYAVALGEGPRGRRHAMVYKGHWPWHDPHPSRAGLVGAPERYLVFAPPD